MARICLSVVVMVSLLLGWGGSAGLQADESVPDPLAKAAQLIEERHFDEALKLLEQTADSSTDRAVAAMARYRLAVCLADVKEHDSRRKYWLSVVEEHLRRIIAEYPEQTETVLLSRVKLIESLLGQGKIDEAEFAAQALLTAAADSVRFNGWARLKLAEIRLTRSGGLDEAGVTAAHQVTAADAQAIVQDCREAAPEVANWARVLAMSSLVANGHFEAARAIGDDLLADRTAGRASDKQAGWGLLFQATSLTRQQRWLEALDSLRTAEAVAEADLPTLRKQAAEELVRLNRRIVDEHFGVGEMAFRRGDWAAAREGLEAAYGWTLQGGGHQLDLIRERLAQVAEKTGEMDLAIAYWRLMIDNPVRPTGKGGEACEVIASLFARTFRYEAEEQWRRYLLDPSANLDPTQALVTRAFGTAPSQPTGAISDLSTRQASLGKLYLRQKRLDDAMAQFDAALASAKKPEQRADALTGKVYVLGEKAQRLGSPRRAEERNKLREEAEPLVREATETWIPLALKWPVGSSHYAIEQAIGMCKVLGKYEQGLATADRIIGALKQAGAPPGKIAWAEYQRLIALSWNNRLTEVITEAQQLDSTYAAREDDTLLRIRSYALLVGTGACARVGDIQCGRTLIDTVEQRNIGQDIRESAVKFRQMLEIYEAKGAAK